MVRVKLWGSLRSLADGQEWVEVEASNFKELLDALVEKHPGLNHKSSAAYHWRWTG